MVVTVRHVPILDWFIVPPRPDGRVFHGTPGGGGARDRPDGCQARVPYGSGGQQKEREVSSGRTVMDGEPVRPSLQTGSGGVGECITLCSPN